MAKKIFLTQSNLNINLSVFLFNKQLGAITDYTYIYNHVYATIIW